jgi:Predicted acyltransferases
MNTNNNRLQYFDWIRGCMILWMLIYHISLNYGRITFGVPENGATIFTFLSFFMAPFYVGSGYFFSTKQSFKFFFSNKLKKIFIPYCFFTIWGVIIYVIYCNVTQSHVLGDLRVIFYSSIPTCCMPTNSPLWFLYSLFVCSIIYYLIKRIGGRIDGFIVILFIFLAYMTHNKVQYFGYGNILLGVSFMHLGYCLKNFNNKIGGFRYVIVSCVIYLTIGFFAPVRLEFVRNILVQGNYWINLVFTIAACFSLWRISQMWNHNNMIERGLIYIGRYSIVIFAAHRPVLNWIIEPVLRRLYPTIPYGVFVFVSLLGLLIICIVLDLILRRYCPLVIGEETLNMRAYR